MTPVVKKLSFVSRDLGIDADLVLAFDDQPIAGIYKDYYPSAFAVRKFGAEGTYRADIIYCSQLAFTKVVISDDVIQSASTEVPIAVGQSVILTQADEIFRFSDPKTDSTVPKKNIQCTNNAPFKEDIGVGFIEKEGDAPKTTLVWRGVGHGQKLNMEFIPRLRGYIDRDPYREDGLIKSPITSDLLFDEDLAALYKHTTWVITYDKNSGEFSIDEEIKSEVQAL
ncbi:hypothetical protein BDR03DRAFT_966062 [Suillus americanus]|nr:hypothetical protein BDR03DRAFT_966062 [Suillus americanus]